MPATHSPRVEPALSTAGSAGVVTVMTLYTTLCEACEEALMVLLGPQGIVAAQHEAPHVATTVSSYVVLGCRSNTSTVVTSVDTPTVPVTSCHVCMPQPVSVTTLYPTPGSFAFAAD